MKNNYYLYVPFAPNEHSEQLCNYLLRWREAEKKYGRNKKAPLTAIHQAKPFAYLQNDFSIYILGHGNQKNPLTICNVDNENAPEAVFLSMSELAQRIKEDGLITNMPGKIKLYFCSSNPNDAKNMAEDFATNLGNGYEQINIHYYNGYVSLPDINADTGNLEKNLYLVK